MENERKKVLEEYDVEVAKLQEKRDILLYILDNGLSVENVIYYPQSKKVEFNWFNSCKKITQEEFDNFMSKLDPSKLPKGVYFHLYKE